MQGDRVKAGREYALIRVHLICLRAQLTVLISDDAFLVRTRHHQGTMRASVKAKFPSLTISFHERFTEIDEM